MVAVVLKLNCEVVALVAACGLQVSDEFVFSAGLDLLIIEHGRNDGEKEVDKAESKRGEGHDVATKLETLYLVALAASDSTTDNGSKAVANTVGRVVDTRRLITEEW